jgi:UDP-N-acetylglucosamine--dolichyl-phosphate N-acetylglucosaminephosphotransferase
MVPSLLKGILGFLVSFLFTWYYLPRYIEKAREKGIVGIDVNKPEHPKVPEMGGIIPVVGFLIALLFFLFMFPNYTSFIIVAGLLVLANAFFGMLDDVFEFRYRDHILSMFLTSALAVEILRRYSHLSTKIYFPFLGWIDFGWFYWIIVLLAFVFLPNAVNIYALFNGLEAGNAAIVLVFFMALIALLHGINNFAIALALASLGALLGFWIYNRYPAKVFPGDVGTLSFGSMLALVLVYGKIEALAALVLLPYFLQFFLHLVRVAKHKKDSRHPIVLPDGTLKVPENDPYKVMYLLLKLKPMKENEVVRYLYLLQIIIGLWILGIAILSLAV